MKTGACKKALARRCLGKRTQQSGFSCVHFIAGVNGHMLLMFVGRCLHPHAARVFFRCSCPCAAHNSQQVQTCMPCINTCLQGETRCLCPPEGCVTGRAAAHEQTELC
eukprot:scaffold119488_cov16-Tisochrysis_lutea.AAC.1